MKKIVFALFALISVSAYGQQSMEFGFNLGASSYLGDLKTQSYLPTQNNISFGLQSRYNFNPLLSARVSLSYGTLEGYDELTDRADLTARNLSFRSRIYEMACIGEFNFYNFGSHPLNNKNKKYYKFAPYVFGGVALFHFNPQAKYKGDWYDLQPLGTEGQDVPGSSVQSYNRTQISIPIGIGFKLELEPNIVISYEVGWRKTFTDYLDDVSGRYFDPNEIKQSNGNLASKLSYRGDELPTGNPAATSIGAVRGNPENDDWYIITNFTISYKLFRSKQGGLSAK